MDTTAIPMPAVADSVASMMAGVPADIFDGIEDITPPSLDGDVTSEEIVDDPEQDIDTETESTEEAPDDASEADATATTPEKDAPAADEELPEGVSKGKDRKGKAGYFLEENRYKTFHGNHQLARQAAELMNVETLTLDAIRVREEALQANDKLFSDLTSGDPTAQGGLVDFMLNEMKSARDAGEVGVDPTVPFVEQVYTRIRDNAPDAYAHLRMMGARDLVGEMFELAAGNGDKNLAAAAQRMALTLANVPPRAAGMTDQQYLAQIKDITNRVGIPFYAPDELAQLVKSEDPVAKLQRENAELRAKISNPGKASDPAEQFGAWKSGVSKAVNSALKDDVVMPSLTSVQDAWKNFPKEYDDLVVGRLNRLVVQEINADANFNSKIAALDARAKRAASAQVREQIGQEIKTAYITRANIAANRHKPDVLKFAAESLKGRSDASHERRSGAQTRTAPKGTSAPVKKSVVSNMPVMKDGIFDSKTAMQQANKLLQSLNR